MQREAPLRIRRGARRVSGVCVQFRGLKFFTENKISGEYHWSIILTTELGFASQAGLSKAHVTPLQVARS